MLQRGLGRPPVLTGVGHRRRGHETGEWSCYRGLLRLLGVVGRGSGGVRWFLIFSEKLAKQGSKAQSHVVCFVGWTSCLQRTKGRHILHMQHNGRSISIIVSVLQTIRFRIAVVIAMFLFSPSTSSLPSTISLHAACTHTHGLFCMRSHTLWYNSGGSNSISNSSSSSE